MADHSFIGPILRVRGTRLASLLAVAVFVLLPWCTSCAYQWCQYDTPPPGHYEPSAPERAFIDTDIWPEEAGVWLDGEYIGIADNFDGYPGYLEVQPGRHRIEFRLAGFRTLRIDLSTRPWLVYRFERDLRDIPGDPLTQTPQQPDGGTR